jgi:hypothetical protein
MWIGVRLTLAGLTKFLSKEEKEFEVTNDAGEVETVAREVWVFSKETAARTMENITGIIGDNSFLGDKESPMFVKMMELYRDTLPWVLLGVGCWVIVGLFSRLSLIVSGLIIISLSFGLLLIGEDVEGTFRAIEILVIGLALITVKHNILAVDNLIQLAIGGDKDGDDAESAPRRKKD